MAQQVPLLPALGAKVVAVITHTRGLGGSTRCPLSLIRAGQLGMGDCTWSSAESGILLCTVLEGGRSCPGASSTWLDVAGAWARWQQWKADAGFLHPAVTGLRVGTCWELARLHRRLV